MNYNIPNEPSETEIYRALPVQLIHADGGVVIKRGCTEVKIMGEGAGEIVNSIWAMISAEGAKKSEILEPFAETDREILGDILDKLIIRQILVPDSDDVKSAGERESSLDIFYWHYGSTENKVGNTLSEKQIIIFGVNSISRRLASSLGESGFEKISVVDFPSLRNLEMFGDEPTQSDNWPNTLPKIVDYADWLASADTDEMDCVVATSDYANTPALQEWNRFCLKNNIPYFPVMLRKMTGFLGPFVIPGETPCYQCLIHRENAHFVNEAEIKRMSEQASYFGQEITGFLPTMGSILGDIATVELVKFYSGIIPYKVGNLIAVNLLGPNLKTIKLLRVPRCLACGKAMTSQAPSLEKADFIPGESFVPGGEHSTDFRESYEERFNAS